MPWSVDEVRTYTYSGAAQDDTLEPGTYKFECWGGEGGTYSSKIGGKGGYSKGEIEVSESSDIYIYVGGASTTATGGWNGGGTSLKSYSTSKGGGGASDIRIGGQALSNRVIVGAGGGGAGYESYGGDGGGLSGIDGGKAAQWMQAAGGGTQLAGGNVGGSLGTGGDGVDTYDGAGGGGYYGGGGAAAGMQGGGGGSSYYGTLANPSTTAGLRSGNGEIKITCLSLDGGGVTKKRRFAQFI